MTTLGTSPFSGQSITTHHSLATACGLPLNTLLAVSTALLLVFTPNNVLALGSIPITAASRQLSPAVMLIGKFDWQVEQPNSPTGQPWSR